MGRKITRFVIVILVLLFLCGCKRSDDHKAINSCLYDQHGEIYELHKRIKELEWKVRSLRDEQIKKFNEYKKMAEEWASKRLKSETDDD